jgi:hypothetical protein
VKSYYYLYSILFLWSFQYSAQNLILNGSFENVDSCATKNGELYNRPVHWRSALDNGHQIGVVSSNTSVCSIAPSIKSAVGEGCLQLGFIVNTSSVRNNFIQSPLRDGLKKDATYELKIAVRRNLFTIGQLRELHIIFTSGPIRNPNSLNMRSINDNIVKVPVSSVSSGEWSYFSYTYQATGTEYFIVVGSIQQKFRFKEGMVNYKAEQLARTLNVPNAIYYIDGLSLQLKDTLIQTNYNEVDMKNVQDIYFQRNNLVVNGGFEFSQEPLDRVLDNHLPGVPVSTGWYNLTPNTAYVACVDSNSNYYRYDRLHGNFPYMGRGVGIVDVMKTNRHHDYMQQWEIVKGDDYNTIHKYEFAPSFSSIDRYEKGAYITGMLRSPLLKDSLYSFGSMIKLSAESSYGVKWVGVYFHQEFPKDYTENLYHHNPDIVFSVEHLAKRSDWQEFSAVYKAQGDEQFFSLGYVVSAENGIVKNRNFKRIVQSTCGPQHRNGYCFNHEITYRDSLFARYYVDNFVVVPANNGTSNAAIFNPDVINHTQFIFDFGGTKKNTRLNVVKKALIQTLDVMRIDDGIAITHINQKTEHKLAPTNYENKRKIIRLIENYKPTIKPGFTVVNDFALLFETTYSSIHANSVVLITEGYANYEPVLSRLKSFTQNGNYLTVICTGTLQNMEKLEQQFLLWSNTRILSSEDPDLFTQLLQFVWRSS